MAIPKFKECFNDVLLFLVDGKSHKTSEICKFVANQKNLSDEERNMRFEKSGQRVLNNRIGWAQTYLKMAGLIEYPEYGMVQITNEGKKALNENQIIDLDYLKRYKSFNDFLASFTPKKENDNPTDITNDKPEQSPEELIENAFLQINKQLANEILDEILKFTPAIFEKLTLRLLNKMGYGGSGTVKKCLETAGLTLLSAKIN